MGTIKLRIDGLEVTGNEGESILAIARANGIEIPTLCHDERVEIYGSCGLCVVEAEGVAKLLRSCSTTATEGMVIQTTSERIDGNRKAALELLFSDHTGDCRPPCVQACPGETDCQGYVGLIANGAYEEAYALIKEKIPFPGSIGRVCPHPCEEACRRELVEEPISIAALKQYAADKAREKGGKLYTAEVAEGTGKKVAVIGGGPGGLTAAYFLRAKGHEVTVYEAMPLMGGMLRYGIPEYRLPKKVLQEEIDAIEGMGVVFQNNVRIGQEATLEGLGKGHDAVVIAIGAWTSTGMGIPGEDLEGVHGGIEFLWNISGITPKLLRRRVAIVGGGNTAMDACRTAVRSGATAVYNVYRRTRNEMPAEESEIEEAEEEGVVFKNLTNPLEIIGEGGKEKSVRLQIMELGEPDASGRRSPVPVEGAEETLEVDVVIMAIGQKPYTPGFEEIEQTRWGTIAADEHTCWTNRENVFAVGDATNQGADIAITAIGEGKRAAEMVDKYLKGEELRYEAPFHVKREMTEEDFAGKAKQARAKMPQRSAMERKKDFQEINYGLSEEEAKREGGRCLECGCQDYYECKLMGYAGRYQADPERYKGKNHQRGKEDEHPYIRRNPDKCILCGLCVRICEEVTGNTCIGFIDRGFDTVIQPAFDGDLRDSGCISCGQCVHVCPTGALTEVMMIGKQVPLEEKRTETVCSFCSLGCKTTLTSSGGLLLRSLPSGEEKKTLLCMRGRFGFGEIGKGERLDEPLVRRRAGMEGASFEEAIAGIQEGLAKLQATYGEESVAVAVSERYTNEEAYLIKEYAKKGLKTTKIYSMGQKADGLGDVLGSGLLTAGMEELEQAELIVAVAPGGEMQRSVAAMRIRRAVGRGAKLLLLTGEDEAGMLEELATRRIETGDSLKALEEIVRALMDGGCGGGIEGVEELRASVKGTEAGPEAREAADMMMRATRAVYIYEKDTVTEQGARLIGDMAVLSGHAGNPGEGIIQILPGANSRGLSNLGIRDGEELYRGVAGGEIRGLVIFGEEAGPGLELGKLEFLAVQDLHMTEAARQADIVLPGTSYAETEGSYTGADNKTRELNKALAGPVAWDNMRQIRALAAAAGIELPEGSAAIRRAMAESAGEGEQAAGAGGIRLAAAEAGALYRRQGPSANELNNRLMQFATEHSLI